MTLMWISWMRSAYPIHGTRTSKSHRGASLPPSFPVRAMTIIPFAFAASAALITFVEWQWVKTIELFSISFKTFLFILSWVFEKCAKISFLGFLFASSRTCDSIGSVGLRFISSFCNISSSLNFNFLNSIANSLKSITVKHFLFLFLEKRNPENPRFSVLKNLLYPTGTVQSDFWASFSLFLSIYIVW